jgi:hypothetical protein
MPDLVDLRYLAEVPSRVLDELVRDVVAKLEREVRAR